MVITVQPTGSIRPACGGYTTPTATLYAELDGCRRVMDPATGEILGALTDAQTAPCKTWPTSANYLAFPPSAGS